MADLTFGSLTTGSTATGTPNLTAAEAIGEGDACYKDTDGTYKKAESGDTDVKAVVVVIALTAAAAATDTFVGLRTGGKLKDSGTPFTAGTAYYLSATAGGICPFADLVSTDYVSLIGIASSTSVLDFTPNNSGVQIA